MSWFTAPAHDTRPPCPRCKKPDFVRLLRQLDDIALFSCGSCPVPTKKAIT